MRTQLKAIVSEMVQGGIPLDMALREFERAFLEASVQCNDGNLSATAKALGIHRNTLSRKLNSDPIKAINRQNSRGKTKS